MRATANARNLRKYKIRFSLIAEQILDFTSSPNMVREVKNLQAKSVTMFYVIKYSHLGRSILLKNSKQFH